jgi:hypothetical protein
MMMRAEQTAGLLVVLLLSCAPAVRSRDGLRVEEIIVREQNAWGHEWPTARIRGAGLRRAVVLLDRQHLIQSSPGERAFQDREASDGSTAIIDIETVEGRQRIVLTNCAQRQVCSFLRDAFDDALVDRIPETCMPILAGHGRESCSSMVHVDEECFVRNYLTQDAGEE